MSSETTPPPAPGSTWGQCDRCGGWIWQATASCSYEIRQAPGYPHTVRPGTHGGAGACQCGPVETPAASPEVNQESEVDRLRSELEAEQRQIEAERAQWDALQDALEAEIERLRSRVTALRDAGDQLLIAAPRERSREQCPDDPARDRAADAWMVVREVEP